MQKKPGQQKSHKKGGNKKPGTPRGGNDHHYPGCNCVTCPIKRGEKGRKGNHVFDALRANFLAAMSWIGAHKQDTPPATPPSHDTPPSPDTTPPSGGGGGNRVPPVSSHRPEAEETLTNRKHGAGCECPDCVPPAKHGKGCECPDCEPPHGKGCMCGRLQCKQAAAAAGTPLRGQPGYRARVERVIHSAPPPEKHGQGCMCPDCDPHGRGCQCTRIGCGGAEVTYQHGPGCQCDECVPQQQQRNRNNFQFVGGQQHGHNWQGGGGRGGNGGGGRGNDMYGGYGGQQLGVIWQPDYPQRGNNLSAYLAHSQQQASAFLAQSQQQGTSFINYMASRLD